VGWAYASDRLHFSCCESNRKRNHDDLVTPALSHVSWRTFRSGRLREPGIGRGLPCTGHQDGVVVSSVRAWTQRLVLLREPAPEPPGSLLGLSGSLFEFGCGLS
jgi:hypothetical protein